MNGISTMRPTFYVQLVQRAQKTLNKHSINITGENLATMLAKVLRRFPVSWVRNSIATPWQPATTP